MRRSGQQPVPTALKILRGNPGQRRIDEAREPKISLTDLPEPTEELNEEGMKAWRRLLPILIPAGLATPADYQGLTAHCQLWSRWVQINRLLNREGEVVMRKGIPELHPLLKQSEALAQQIRQYLCEYGLTPASRTRIKVDAPKPKSKGESFREKHSG